jgi:hypothetical protein
MAVHELALKAMDTAVKDGYIEERSADSEIRSMGSSKSGDVCCCLCIGGGGGRRGGKQEIILVVVLFALSFFVGLYYAANSARSALSHQYAINKINHEIKQIEKPIIILSQPDPSPMPFAPPNTNYPLLYAQPSSPLSPVFCNAPCSYPLLYDEAQVEAQVIPPISHLDSPNLRDLKILNETKVLYEGMRNERVAACFSQSLMTIGSGLLTVAFLTAFFCEGEIILQGCLVTGGGALIGGIAAYTFKHIAMRYERENEAYQFLSSQV